MIKYLLLINIFILNIYAQDNNNIDNTKHGDIKIKGKKCTFDSDVLSISQHSEKKFKKVILRNLNPKQNNIMVILRGKSSLSLGDRVQGHCRTKRSQGRHQYYRMCKYNIIEDK